MSRQFSWVYYDTVNDQLALVMRPHRFEYKPKYRVIQAHSYGRFGRKVIYSVGSCSSQTFRKRFSFVGRYK